MKAVTKGQEKEADQFARCLLMPEQMFRQSMMEIGEKMQDPDKTAKALAKMYEVPLVQAVIRMQELR